MTDLRTALEMKARQMGMAQGQDLAPMSWETQGAGPQINLMDLLSQAQNGIGGLLGQFNPQQSLMGLLGNAPDPRMSGMGKPQQAPALQSLPPPPMAMMSAQAPTPAGVPSFRKPAPKPAMMSPELAAKRKAEPYTVRKGDNLTKIAKQHGLTLKQLLAKNPDIKNPDRIKIGQTIKL
jgi:hypothetical protein